MWRGNSRRWAQTPWCCREASMHGVHSFQWSPHRLHCDWHLLNTALQYGIARRWRDYLYGETACWRLNLIAENSVARQGFGCMSKGVGPGPVSRSSLSAREGGRCRGFVPMPAPASHGLLCRLMVDELRVGAGTFHTSNNTHRGRFRSLGCLKKGVRPKAGPVTYEGASENEVWKWSHS